MGCHLRWQAPRQSIRDVEGRVPCQAGVRLHTLGASSNLHLDSTIVLSPHRAIVLTLGIRKLDSVMERERVESQAVLGSNLRRLLLALCDCEQYFLKLSVPCKMRMEIYRF